MNKIEERIDWKGLDSQYVRLEPGVSKQLKLTNWTGGEFFGRLGINFDVLEENGDKTAKPFTVTSKPLIRQLRPIIVKAEERGQDSINVSILRTGEGQETRYAIEVLEEQRGDYIASLDS